MNSESGVADWAPDTHELLPNVKAGDIGQSLGSYISVCRLIKNRS